MNTIRFRCPHPNGVEFPLEETYERIEIHLGERTVSQMKFTRKTIEIQKISFRKDKFNEI